MKLTINLDMEEYNEGSMVDAIVKCAANQVVDEQHGNISDAVEKALVKAIDEEALRAVKNAVKETLEEGVQTTNTWGELQGKRRPFKEYLIEEVKKIVYGKVDSQGHPSNYNSDKAFINYAIESVARMELDALQNQVKKEIHAALSEEVRKRLSTEVTTAVLENIKMGALK